MADPATNGNVPDRFELPRPNELDKITWNGDVLVANFNGITGNHVDRPEIHVDRPHEPAETESVFYPYKGTFKLLIDQPSAVVAVAHEISSLSTFMTSLVGQGLDGAAKAIQTKLMDLLKGKHFTVRAKTRIDVVRLDPKEGKNDVFIKATADSRGYVDSAGDGMTFLLETKINAGQSGKRPPSAADESTTKVEAPKTGDQQHVEVKAQDAVVFRQHPASTKHVEVTVLARAIVDSVVPTAKIDDLVKEIKSKLRSQPELAKNDKITDPKDAGVDIGKWFADVLDFVEKLATAIVNSFTPRVAAFVVDSTNVEFTTVTETGLKTLRIEPSELALAPATTDGELTALALGNGEGARLMEELSLREAAAHPERILNLSAEPAEPRADVLVADTVDERREA
jgi:hypothetical protein